MEYLNDTFTVGEALEKISFCAYTVLPVIDSKGHYIGSISKYDLERYLEEADLFGISEPGKQSVGKVPRHKVNKAVNIEISMEQLAQMAINQDFVPVIDSRGMLVGIVTRKSIFRHSQAFTTEG